MDRPIIFLAPMIHAPPWWRKSQTRRVLTPQPETVPNGFAGVHLRHAPGDRLWVREVWGIGISDHGDCQRQRATLDYRCGDKIKSPPTTAISTRWGQNNAEIHRNRPL